MGEGLDAESTLFSASLIYCRKSEGTIVLFYFLLLIEELTYKKK